MVLPAPPWFCYCLCTPEACLCGKVRSQFGVSLGSQCFSEGEGIMNEILRHQNLCSLCYLLAVKVGSGSGGMFGKW